MIEMVALPRAVTGLSSETFDAKKASIISLSGFRSDIFWAI